MLLFLYIYYLNSNKYKDIYIYIHAISMIDTYFDTVDTHVIMAINRFTGIELTTPNSARTRDRHGKRKERATDLGFETVKLGR